MSKSTAEDSLARHLTALGIEYEREYRFHPTRKWRADFYIPAGRLIVEVEGVGYAKGSHTRHQWGRGYEEDCIKYNEAAAECGLAVLRFTPDLVKGKGRGARNTPHEPAIDTIARYLGRER